MTNQISERLTYKGETVALESYPNIPKDHPRVAVDRSPVAESDLAEKIIRGSTACWRGYQGAWKIVDDRLYLIGILGRYRLLGEEPLLADWFSGDLNIPQGELIGDGSDGFVPLHEMDLVIEIVQGSVRSSRLINNSGTRAAQQKFLLDLYSRKLTRPWYSAIPKAMQRLFCRR